MRSPTCLTNISSRQTVAEMSCGSSDSITMFGSRFRGAAATCERRAMAASASREKRYHRHRTRVCLSRFLRVNLQGHSAELASAFKLKSSAERSTAAASATGSLSGHSQDSAEPPTSCSNRRVSPCSLMAATGMAVRSTTRNPRPTPTIGGQRSLAIANAIAKPTDCSPKRAGSSCGSGSTKTQTALPTRLQPPWRSAGKGRRSRAFDKVPV